MKLYKLTKQDGTTYHGYQYAVALHHSKPKISNPELCSSDVFHAYKDISLAMLLNPIHADIHNPRLFEIEGDVAVEDWGRVGSFEQTIVKELELPAWVGSKDELDIRATFAILCAKAVYRDKLWNKWADDWLSGADRSSAAARAAEVAQAAEAASAARAAAQAAAEAARAASEARAAWAARAAAEAAWMALAAANSQIDFRAIANQAVDLITRKESNG